jgi:PilZ domain
MPAGSAATSDRSSGRNAFVWIEDAASHISRGQADSVTRDGFHVNLAEAPAFHQGDEVAVRLAFERGAPTFATTARVAWVREGAATTECSLQWSASAAERKALEAWINRAA